ncbi:Crossover junction endonuclease mus81 [Apophysomyces sp. BC1034]|nr:Crossover junction endonuclease mus81 [Apophysomyces sp. BC1021]KAG0194598.1 Crossover junction endonuclease mus81 [Apophysomyces sp. BC1034]
MPEIPCGNPLLRDWIGEWMEDEKAYDSISKCPVQFAHPSEAEKLHGIGKVISEKLEKRMIDHCKANDLPLPVRTKGNKRRAGTQGQEGEGENSSAKKTRRSPKKPYVPRYRSGPYAILLALLDHREDNLQQATKEQITRQAEDYCDTSFDMPDPGKNYTAWNSIKTLLEKDYVWKNGSPAKYMLTDSGYEMAKQLKTASQTDATKSKGKQKATNDDNAGGEEEIDLSLYVLNPEQFRKDSAANKHITREENKHTTENEETDLSLYVLNPEQFRKDSAANKRITHEENIDPYKYSSEDEEIDLAPYAPSSSHIGKRSIVEESDQNLEDDSQGFHYEYVDTENQPVRHITQAAIEVDGIHTCLAYRVRFSSNQRYHPKAKGIITVQNEGDICLGWMPEDLADTICSGLPATPLLPLHVEEQDDFWPNHSQPVAAATEDRTLIDYRETQSQPISTDTHHSMTQYPPDSYEIVLVLDNREIKMRSNRDYILEKLESKGIKVVKRALELGDMIWIAQKKGSNSPSDELFLDIVIERKRMDDLVSSIKDGRFREQKFRLQQAGARKVVYIVEEYNKEEAERFGMQAIQTVMSSTQVVDGFFLKRTNTIDDTIDYLVSVTKMVKKLYQNTTLYRIPEHLVCRQDFLHLKETYGSSSTEAFVVTYPLYNRLNSKYGTSMLQDLYMRMLMTIRGVSVEKASALIKVYPTPRKLLEAMKAVDEDEGKMLAKEATKNGISRRKWSGPLSERLWQVWGAL